MRKWLFLSLLFILTACNAASKATHFIGTDITGAEFGKPLSLTDHNGKLRSMSDFKGKVVVMFFGYTHCPDVCPTTMSDLRQTMKLLGKDADQVQVLFVTVDPDRDTQEVLAQFVPSFDKRFIGLRGSLQEVAENMGSYKIFASKVISSTDSHYTIDHSAGLYVFDKKGAARIYMSYGQKPADIANDLKQLF
ncbi:MAG: SCO family protein [Methylophilaceae bacterium 17-44-8]|jgi:protein SCO1/2|nr:MAG: SCO family protein [Methylophilales bacterium 28-44-11]OZA06290.1 MAG: SCO family protein [Methylophilaceae bacterium 17-44-8]